MVQLQFPVRGPKATVVDGQERLLLRSSDFNPFDLINPDGAEGTVTVTADGVVKTMTFSRDHSRLQITSFVIGSLWNRFRWWAWYKKEETIIGHKPTFVLIEITFKVRGRERNVRQEYFLQMA